MQNKDKIDIKNYLKLKQQGWELSEELRKEDLRKLDTVTALQQLAGAFDSALFMHSKPKEITGLVKMQAYFKKAHKKG